jgi:hypothetical protein
MEVKPGSIELHYGVEIYTMPNDTTTSCYRVCILILTYKRNIELLRLVSQTRDMIERYRGHNQYTICVADSDPNNPIAPLSPDLKIEYSINPGHGFDDNIYYFWRNNVDKYDFILSMGDDDLFTPWLNPLYLLDAAMDTGHQAALFNHRTFTSQPNGTIDVGGVSYPEVGLLSNKTQLLHRVLTAVPTHIGILYSTKLLKITLDKAWEFRNTLHLYAVPAIFAATSNTLLFSDYNLCLYQDGQKTDGAWGISANVMNGLIDFLKKLKQFLPADLYSVAEAGFFRFYFNRDSWLRQKIGNDPMLKSEEQITEMLAAS